MNNYNSKCATCEYYSNAHTTNHMSQDTQLQICLVDECVYKEKPNQYKGYAYSSISKEKIIGIINTLKLYMGDEYVIYMGGSLVMNNLRNKTNDLDLVCSVKAYDKLVTAYHPERQYNSTLKNKKFDLYMEGMHIEVFEQDDKGKLVSTCVEGILCQPLEKVLELKKSLNREKDQKDIKAIEEYLNRRK